MSDRKKPDPLLEFRRLGEIPPALENRAASNLDNPDTIERLHELREDDRRILEEMPVGAMAAGIKARLAKARRAPAPFLTASGWRWALVPALGLCAIALVVFPSRREESGSFEAARPETSPEAATHPEASTETVTSAPVRASAPNRSRPGPQVVAMVPTPDDGIRTKGDIPRLRVHLVDERRMVATALADGDTVSKCSILQVSLLAGPSVWVAVVSIDAAGAITRHIPEQGDSSILVEGALQAPHSFQIDSTPGWERFVLLRSDRPFALSGIARSLRGETAGTHPQAVQSLRLVKREILP